jgi:hypothetical protein
MLISQLMREAPHLGVPIAIGRGVDLGVATLKTGEEFN